MNNTGKKQRHTGQIGAFLQVLASMNLAIMLLVIIAIASVIGTILQQNQPYQDYIIKFGPFWHEIYKQLGLYDVYASLWFILILAFLVISVCVCVIRNGPSIIRSLQRFNLDISESSVKRYENTSTWVSPQSVGETRQAISDFLADKGYRTRTSEIHSRAVIAAMKGSANRIGYLLTHIAIILICIGGLLDGNLPMKLKSSLGEITVETRDLPVSEIPEKSRLPADNPSFRASVLIPEGARVNYAFTNLSGGYLLQYLPFSIQIRDFRIEHYASGQPKSFTSDLVIKDPDKQLPMATSISVNHPLIYKGYSIYQSSFADGGSRLKLLLHEVLDNQIEASRIDGIINKQAEIYSNELFRIEYDDFRRFNIFPDESGTDGKFVDYGPSFSYKARKTDGTAREYVNYMYPVPRDGRLFFISGMRSSPNEEFQYLYLPVDDNDGLDRFFRFQALLNDVEKSGELISEALSASLDDLPDLEPEFRKNVTRVTLKLIDLFRSGGINAIEAYHKQQFAKTNDTSAVSAYTKLLHTGLQQIYLHILEEDGMDIDRSDPSYQVYFEDVLAAMNAFHHYGIPFYLQMVDFEHIQASGLQITRTPGKNLVYSGFLMLIIGVFFLFYIHHQRIWVVIAGSTGETSVSMAGTRVKHRRDFVGEFNKLAGEAQSLTNGKPNRI